MTDEKLALTDVETTGLRPEDGHLLLEIAVLPASPVYPFTALTDTVFHAVIQQDPQHAWDLADDYVRKMHTKTGLWGKLEHGTPLAEVDTALLAYLKQFADVPLQLRVAGNSVRLDMNFLDAYLPLSAAFLNYRFLDISGLAFYAHSNHQVPYYAKKLAHTAGDDIIESLAELIHTHEGIVAALRPAH